MSNKLSYLNDTIVAAATPQGQSGVSVIRISGKDTENIGKIILRSLPKPRSVKLKKFYSLKGEILDWGIAVYFPGPKSFTGESVLELHCHGSPVVTSSIINEIVTCGARFAGPGEFSKRAFINEKLDLVQAEAVSDLISSQTEKSAKAAIRSMTGEFSKAVELQKEKLTLLRVHIEAAIDFPDEEIDFLSDKELIARIQACDDSFSNVIKVTSMGRLLRDGYKIVIAGKPNAGKSSLFNLLVGSNSAIVTDIAGTTRDVLRETINIDGIAVELRDTAGFQQNVGVVEKEGIRRARKTLLEADIVLWVNDIAEEKENIPNEISSLKDVKAVLIHNKIDLIADAQKLNKKARNTVYLSAKTGKGLDILLKTIKSIAGHEETEQGTYTARQRHIEALRRSFDHFKLGKKAFYDKKDGAIVAEELRLSHDALCEITGEVTNEEILGRIFSEFCIGK